MPTWSEVTLPYGEYISEVFNISNVLDRYIINIETEEINIHDQKMNFYFSVSNDMVNWSEWKMFYKQSTDFLNEYKLFQLYFRYKIIISSDDFDKRPYLQSIKMSLEPYTLFENFGDLSLKPKLWITKRNGSGDVKLLNHMTGQEMKFTGLLNNEEIYVDCENEDIISSFQNSGIYRFDNHNDEWVEMNYGETYIKGCGDFDLNIRYQGKLLQD
ncbi:tail protein [Psychrobacillus phage Perkons]|nr:tail protein [Psychrobacillus phage Perkons]